jgi:hypothetical protein
MYGSRTSAFQVIHWRIWTIEEITTNRLMNTSGLPYSAFQGRGPNDSNASNVKCVMSSAPPHLLVQVPSRSWRAICFGSRLSSYRTTFSNQYSGRELSHTRYPNPRNARINASRVTIRGLQKGQSASACGQRKWWVSFAAHAIQLYAPGVGG